MNNQEAIKILGQYDVSNIHFYTTDGEEIPFTEWSDAIDMAISALQEQDLQPNLQQTCNLATDTISRQAAIDIVAPYDEGREMRDALEDLPSAQPTLYGYPVEHLVLIARVLQKENLPPERVAKMLSDIGRIIEMARDEFEEMLRKAVEGCVI